MFQIAKNLSSGARNTVKNISSEIIRECLKQGVTLCPEVALMGVGLLCLDPERGLSIEGYKERIVIESFVKFCVEKLVDEESFFEKILKMQSHFLNNAIDLERVIRKYQSNIDEKTHPVYREIIEVENPNRDELENLFKKIMIYINMIYLLGSPNNSKVLTETSHALKSVISQADLADFFTLREKDRAKQLVEIQEIVCGIRVFNKDAGHCGEGIRDIQSDLQYAYENTKTALTDRLDTVASRVSKLSNTLTSLFEICYINDTIKILSDQITEDNFNYLKNMLTMNVQHESYMKSLLKVLNQVKTDIDRQLDEYRKVLDIIHNIVQYRTAVPTEKVFPHFARVSILWQSLLNCIYILIEVNKMNQYLSALSDMHVCDSLLKTVENSGVVKRIPKETSALIQGISNELMKSNLPFVASSSQAVNQSITPISKFCPYLFLIGDGLLISSKTVAGYIKHDNILLSFSTAENAKYFLKRPEENFQKFITTLCRHPEVVVFFDIYDTVSAHHFLDAEVKKEKQSDPGGELIKDSAIQTELHPIPYHKDPAYSWNIWSLRKKAIKLANLKKCRTHSAQTEVSFNRLNASLQTVSLKENSCQTMCDAYTNTSKKDASTNCANEDEGANSLARCGIRTTLPLKDYCSKPYDFSSQK